MESVNVSTTRNYGKFISTYSLHNALHSSLVRRIENSTHQNQPKSVTEIIQMVMRNRTPTNRRANQDQSNNTEIQRNGHENVEMTSCWQQPEPMEPRITSLAQATIPLECRFVKDDLKRVRVIGQVDKKFIAATINVNGKDSLVLFDQHAVHERICLENLLAEMHEEDGSIKCVKISPPLELEFSEVEVLVLSLYLKEFKEIGLLCELVVPGFNNVVRIHTAPVCFVERFAAQPRYNRDELIVKLIQNSIEAQIEHIIETDGNINPIPKETFDILCSQACRGAIKFGDELDRPTCQILIDQLSLCNSPFQCAHGRPVLAPLLDLTSVPETMPYQAH